ncbi:MAG: ribosomal protein S19 family protein [Nanoarchaeota archaeon]
MNKNKKPEITRKEVMYRGKTLEYLKTLDVRESAKFMNSSSRRYILKNFDVVERFIKRCEKKLANNKKIKTHDRDLVIVPKLIGLTIGIHNGRIFQDILMLPDMIGHRLGEFTPTRSKVAHGAAGIGATKGSRGLKK